MFSGKFHSSQSCINNAWSCWENMISWMTNIKWPLPVDWVIQISVVCVFKTKYWGHFSNYFKTGNNSIIVFVQWEWWYYAFLAFAQTAWWKATVCKRIDFYKLSNSFHLSEEKKTHCDCGQNRHTSLWRVVEQVKLIQVQSANFCSK